MNEFTLGQIDIYCNMVLAGVKPAACFPIQSRHKEESLKQIEVYGLKIYCNTLADGWETIWIYKYDHILEVIKASPDFPKNTFDHWLLGKLFGYSEEAISQFLGNLSKTCFITSRAGR